MNTVYILVLTIGLYGTSGNPSEGLYRTSQVESIVSNHGSLWECREAMSEELLEDPILTGDGGLQVNERGTCVPVEISE